MRAVELANEEWERIKAEALIEEEPKSAEYLNGYDAGYYDGYRRAIAEIRTKLDLKSTWLMWLCGIIGAGWGITLAILFQPGPGWLVP